MDNNVHDLTRRAARFAQHVTELAVAFDVRVTIIRPVRGHAIDRAGAGYLRADAHRPIETRRSLIAIPPVTDEVTYAAALHELGHCLSPLGRIRTVHGSRDCRTRGELSTLRDVRLLLDEERAAWEWAHHYALEWTDVMTYVERVCLDSYVAQARRFGVTRP